MFSYRALNFYGLIICIGSLSFAVLYLERTLFLEPCPLCVLDRVVIAALGMFFLLALVHNPRSTFAKIYGLISVFFCLAGVGLASRHIWLQGLPTDQAPECTPDIYFMLDTMPFFEVIKKSISGSGSCVEVDWTFMGLSIPEQTLILFFTLLILSIIQTVRPRQPV